MTTEPAPISEINILIEVKNTDGVKGFLCSIYRQVSKHDKALSVGDNLLIPWSLLTFHLAACSESFCILEAVLRSRQLNSILLFHFII